MEEATACRTEQGREAAHFCVYSYKSTQVNQKYSLESTERSNSIEESTFLWKSGTVLHPSLNLYIHLNRDGLTMDLTGLAKSLWKKVIKEAQQQGHNGKVEGRNVQGCAHKGNAQFQKKPSENPTCK